MPMLDFTWAEIAPPKPQPIVYRQGPYIRWTAEMDDALRSGRAAGLSCLILAERIGVCPSTIARRLVELGMPTRLWSGRPPVVHLKRRRPGLPPQFEGT